MPVYTGPNSPTQIGVPLSRMYRVRARNVSSIRVPVDVLAPAHARVRTAVDEAGKGVVVRGVDAVRQRVAELVELGRVPIAVQEEDVVGIDRADRRLEPPVERADRRPLGIRRLVDRVVAGDPGIAAIVVGDVLPEVDHAVLELPLRPEVRPLRGVVAVPVLILGAGHRVQIEDRVDAVARARVDHGVEQPEALLADLERCVVALEVPVVERDPNRVQAQIVQEGGIPIGEEHREEPIEEPLVALIAEHAAQRPALLRLGAGIPGDEVLHVHPAAEAESARGSDGVGRRRRSALRPRAAPVPWFSPTTSVRAVHETGGRVIVTVPSSSRAVSFVRTPTRSWSCRVFAAWMSSS